jgi:hypothetical protein
MNPLDYIEYLGHSSVYPPLVDQLSRDKITWRPTVRRNLDTTYFVSEEGVVLHLRLSIISQLSIHQNRSKIQ